MLRIICSLLLSLNLCLCMAQATMQSHVVQRGESIESIARKYAISVEDLKKANPSVEKYFYVGMKLKIPEIKVETKTSLVENKDSFNEEMYDKGFITDSTSLKEMDEESSSNGLINNAYEINFTLRPKFNTYGYRIAFLCSEFLYIPLDMVYTSKTVSASIGIGPGIKYSWGPVMLHAAVTPYIGFNMLFGSGSNSKTDFSYGMYFSFGAGVKVSKRLFINGGYYIGAGEYEFNKRMLKDGMGMIGLVVEM